MATMPYFVLGPSMLMSLLGLFHGPDRTVPTPTEDYRDATIDLVIPAFNEERNIVICLESLVKQTLKPHNIIIVDDGSTDNTTPLAIAYADAIGLKVKAYRREKSEGKTATLHMAALESTSDVIFILDADTTLRSENYIETLVKELYQGVGIACACGIILPELPHDREVLLQDPNTYKFAEEHPEVNRPLDATRWQKMLRVFTNSYREELYLFLQKFIYRGEMVYFGSIINPVGCAVAYRRKYLADVLLHYHKLLGYDLTTSEDIFIGFAFADIGYRNIQVQGVYALTVEPRLTRLPKQIMMWSSAFLQSCYYFDNLVRTPFKFHRQFGRYLRQKFSRSEKEIQEKRKIKEQYRQSFGVELTKRYGRPIGWFIFSSLLEKICYPTALIIMVILQMWEAIIVTLLAETTIYTVFITFMHKNRRIKNFIKSILFTPVRYMVLIYDYVIILNFAKDLWITKNREWRK